ncbi:MAG: M20 family metallo-hydrolase [Tissierellia bacterium]|nr:M20 family metallo-hydrolase [Tissierellia bacterium]
MDINVIRKRVEKDLEELKQFTASHGNGCTRMPFTKETRDAAEYLKKVMREANLEVREDSVGNVIGLRKGLDSGKPAIVSGSHYDSVYNGGNYDGIAGVISAIELARLLDEEGIELENDFIVVGFMDEEGTRFGTGYFGSKSILGEIEVADTKHYLDKDGISIYEAMKDYGLVAENIPKAKWDDGRIGAFIELHIEQGPVLDTGKIELGLVEGIVGIQRYMFKVKGRADHAGTTPMDMRKDAVEIASKVISKIPDKARSLEDGSVATTGFINVIPGGMNIIAQEVEFSVDIRSMKNESIEIIRDFIIDSLDMECKKVDASFDYDTKLIVEPIELDRQMLGVLEEASKERGYSYKVLPSGAGHDSLAIGQNHRAVMVFVPSKNGRSHSPEEYTDYMDIAKGIDVMYELVKKLKI